MRLIKKAIVLFIVLLGIVQLTACTLKTYPMIDSTYNAEVIEIDGVTYKSRPDTLWRTNARVLIGFTKGYRLKIFRASDDVDNNFIHAEDAWKLDMPEYFPNLMVREDLDLPEPAAESIDCIEIYYRTGNNYESKSAPLIYNEELIYGIMKAFENSSSMEADTEEYIARIICTRDAAPGIYFSLDFEKDHEGNYYLEHRESYRAVQIPKSVGLAIMQYIDIDKAKK